MIELSLANIENYLTRTFPGQVRLTGVGDIGSLDEQGMKDFGYGKPMLVSFEVDGRPRQAVLSMMRGDKYGHQFLWDRAAILMFQYDAGSRMPKHVCPLGLGYVDGQGRLEPVLDPKEFFIVNEKVEGDDYFLHLERIKNGEFRDSDVRLARDFAAWLSEVHARKHEAADLYVRRTRQLLGDSECIWGIVDGYPFPYEPFPVKRIKALEKRLIDWRWKLRGYTHRLCAVHGDFHPWNVLVRPDGDFTVLDRSRGEWGEPADDVSTMTCNYLLFSLYGHAGLGGHFEALYTAFWEEYLGRTEDSEMLEVIAPYFVFRALVIASPEWYPNHPPQVREGLFRFMERVLDDEVFDWRNINKYMVP
ncbi:MAG: aminoglycoside phosphotransferase family protein [Deltaproteobacteria bacterium]|nr:aminoglycoside phosphotransferase family protein [Deltaproteobacteria bacterium]